MTSTRHPAISQPHPAGPIEPLTASEQATVPAPPHDAAHTSSPPTGDGPAVPCRRRIVVALGGNAMTGPGGTTTPAAQQAAAEQAMEQVAELLAAGHQVVLTHGNGPQVGDLVVQNELARSVVAPLPLDWCVAQTQATLGMLVMTALERALAGVGLHRPVTTLVSRVLVDPDDPAWRQPTKPIGRFVGEAEARAGIAQGRHYRRQGSRGWRRVVPSPEPRTLLDEQVITNLVESGVVVIAGGGGGVPMVREGGRLRGVEAVLDKDFTAVLLARAVRADCLVIATDVEQVSTAFGTPAEQPIGRVTPAALRRLADAGHFASGSMAPKVEAAIRFVSGTGQPTAASPHPPAATTATDGAVSGANGTNGTATGLGPRAVITSLARLAQAVTGEVGTIVEAAPPATSREGRSDPRT